jgi:hypothetical protein
MSDTVSQMQLEGLRKPQAGGVRSVPYHIQYTIYVVCLAVSISIWFIAIRAPLWLDETVSIFLIKGGFAGIMSRQVWPDAPAYSCILWLWTKMTGRGEVTLRVLSVLVMLGAVYLLYRAALELFDRDVALIAAIIFCLHPIVIFASIDIRPYAFAVLAIITSIFVLVRLRHSKQIWLAALFGLSAAWIVYLQLLFAVILPAFAICFVAPKIDDRKTLGRQLGIALIVFAIAFLPVIPRLHYMFHTSGTHVFSAAPPLMQLVETLTSKRMAFIFIGTVVVAAAMRRLNLKSDLDGWSVLLCASLALVPALILYGISVGTSIHVFVPRYRLVAIPGIALCWALLVSRIDSRALRLLFCIALVGATAVRYYGSPTFTHHGYSWKYALDVAEQNASGDGAPVLICSDLPESDYMSMPVGAAVEDSGILAPLSYYKLSVPVVALPRALNGEAIRDGSRFAQQAATGRQRFLALGFLASYSTLDWLAAYTSRSYSVRQLGVFDGVKVLEFTPRLQPVAGP